MDPRGRPYFWIGGEAPTGVPEPGTDFGALIEGYASITPLHLDLTAWKDLEAIQGWIWQVENGRQAGGRE
jgi:5'-nucleotidase